MSFLASLLPTVLRSRTIRLAAWWLLVAVLAVAAILGDGDEESDPAAQPEVVTKDDGKLRIASIKPIEAYAGSAVVLHYTGHDPQGPADIRVAVAKLDAEVLHSGPEQLVVRLPSDLSPGPAKVRVYQGDRRSKPKEIRIKPLRTRRLLRNLAGGLALFVFGLRTLARGMRGYAGHPMRAAIARWTQGRSRALGFGVLAGGVTQSVTSGAALVVGMLESKLLPFTAALVVLLGVHIGAGTAILVLPLGISRESLWIVALGVVWITLARHRRGESAGKLVLGLGLLFYGLSILRSGFQPIVGDPGALPYLESLRDSGATGLWARLGAGAVLGALLQGPGAAFGLVLSIGESTALVSQRQGLEIMAATNIGASLGTVLVALPFGREAKRLALAHLCVAALCTAVFLVLVAPAVALSGAILPSDPTTLAYGKKILLPHFDEHLALSFAAAQVLAVILVTPLVPPLAAAAARLVSRPTPTGSGTGTSAGDLETASETLVRCLEADQRIMDATLALLTTGARQQATTGEEGVANVRTDVKRAIEELGHGPRGSQMTTLRACVSVLQLQQSLEQLQRLAERGIEKDFDVDGATVEAFTSLHELTRTGMTRAIRHIEDSEALDIENARSREIETNACEADLRERQLAELRDRATKELDILWRIEVISVYENVGNDVYRLAEVLVEDSDDF